VVVAWFSYPLLARQPAPAVAAGDRTRARYEGNPVELVPGLPAGGARGPVIRSERETIEAEIAFYRDQPPPAFMRDAVDERIAKLRARLKELGPEK
jgi:hypothetical protein